MHRYLRAGTTGRVLMVCALAIVGLGSMPPAATHPLSDRCDFDDDGFDDLAIGAPGEDVDGAAGAGVIHVTYGGDEEVGLDVTTTELWWQGNASVVGVAEDDDAFGSSLACGDFNLDGVDDLAVGVPREDVDDVVDAGAVNVLYGVDGVGLSATGNQLWSQAGSIADPLEAGDLFGSSLAVGDFDDDAIEDLAIGVPGENITFRSGSATGSNVERQAGGVNVIYGTGSGLTEEDNQFWSQKPEAVFSAPEEDDLFGASLAAGDFDDDVGGDGSDDLAIGVPGEGFSVGEDFEADAGAVHILHGKQGTGLTTADSQFWTQESPGVQGGGEEYDQFGAALASGDFDGEGFDDLAIGVPGEGSPAGAGLVNVLYSGAAGLTASSDQMWSQESDSVKGVAEGRDGFGTALAAGNFNGEAPMDLAIGVPGEDIGAGDAKKFNAGTVQLLFGAGPSGLDGAVDVLVTQEDFAPFAGPQEGDTFGLVVAAGDFDTDSNDELAIAAPGDSIENMDSAGVVNVRNPGANQTWRQGQTLLGAAQSYDRLGGPPASTGVYRIPYADGTEVRVNGDHLSHTPLTRIDLGGRPDGDDHTVVAAADGVIRALVDSHGGPDEDPDVHSCQQNKSVPSGRCSDYNNYIWIEHANGEWTKYSHLATDSAPSGLEVGDSVSAGDILGIESDVGRAGGDHLHFEVAVPDDPSNAFSVAGGFIKGSNRIPLICGIPGNVFIQALRYDAAAC